MVPAGRPAADAERRSPFSRCAAARPLQDIRFRSLQRFCERRSLQRFCERANHYYIAPPPSACPHDTVAM